MYIFDPKCTFSDWMKNYFTNSEQITVYTVDFLCIFRKEICSLSENVHFAKQKKNMCAVCVYTVFKGIVDTIRMLSAGCNAVRGSLLSPGLTCLCHKRWVAHSCVYVCVCFCTHSVAVRPIGDIHGSVFVGEYEFEGATLNTIEMSASPIIDAESLGNALCANAFSEDDVSGKIVLCQRGDVKLLTKSYMVYAAGAVGMVLYNSETDSETLV